MEEIGDIKVGKIILLQHEALKHSQEISQEGYIPVIVHDDLDIQFALEAMELLYNEKIGTLAFATENEKLLPLFIRARELGKDVVLFETTKNDNRSLKNAADLVLSISF